MRVTLDHRAGHVEARGGRLAAGDGQEGRHDRLQARKVEAAELLLGDRIARPPLGREQREPRLGAADVASQQGHGLSLVQICRGGGTIP